MENWIVAVISGLLGVIFFMFSVATQFDQESTDTPDDEDFYPMESKKKSFSKEYNSNSLEPLKLYVFDREASFDIEVKGVLKIPNANIKELQFAIKIYDITDTKTSINSLIVEDEMPDAKSNLMSNVKTQQQYVFLKKFKVDSDQTLKFIRPRLLISLFKGDLDFVRQGKVKLLFELTINDLSRLSTSDAKIFKKVLTSQRTISIQFKDYPKLRNSKTNLQKDLLSSKNQDSYCTSCGNLLKQYANYCSKCGRHVDDLGEVKMENFNTKEVSMLLEGYGVIFQYRFVSKKVADVILDYLKREEETDVYDGIDLVEGGEEAIQRLTSKSLKGEVSEEGWAHSFEGVQSLKLKNSQEEVELEPSIPYEAHQEYPVGRIILDSSSNPEELSFVIIHVIGGGMDIDQKIEIDDAIDSLEDLENRNIKLDNLYITIYGGPKIYLENYELNEIVHEAFMILKVEDLEDATIQNIMSKSIYWNEIS
jgi:hypothetical protein